jgi:phytoene synthase
MNNYLEILKKNGKSFYWAGQLLPKKYLIRCAELYSFCRLLDDIADSKIKADNSSILKNILNLIKKDDYHKLKNYKINIPDYLKKSELAKAKIIDLIDGLIFDQKQVRIKNERELILYCYRVAGTVGVLMCIALDCKEKKSHDFAIDLGIAMQLTNILRDIKEDAELNRRYLPGNFVKNLTPKQIINISQNIKHKDHLIVQEAIKKILHLSNLYYKSGNAGLFFLKFQFKIVIAVASNIYRQIGVKLKNKSYNWYEGRIFTTIYEKFKITIKTILSISLFFKINSPKHKLSLHKHLKEIL